MSYMTKKGQVTVPKDIREALGLKEGDVVEFHLRGEEAVLTKRRSRGILGLEGIAAKRRARVDHERGGS